MRRTMPRKSTRPRGFGKYLVSLRESRNETQLAFAKTLHVSRSVIGNVETGTPPSAPFLATLEAFFSEKTAEIAAEAQRYAKRPRARSGRPKDYSTFHTIITVQIDAGELLEAKEALLHEVGLRSPSVKHRLWCVETLSRIERRLGDIQPSRRRLMCAIDLARLVLDDDAAAIALWDECVVDCYRDSRADNGLDAAEMALAHYPGASQLWYRKGLIHWDKGEWSNSYAALTTALRHKAPRVAILYVRGQVLLEWGFHEEAIVDLDEILAGSELLPMQILCARSARACALFMSQQYEDHRRNPQSFESKLITIEQAFGEFAHSAKDMPGSPWPSYYRALCLIAQYRGIRTYNDIEVRLGRIPPGTKTLQAIDTRECARRELERTLNCDHPSLNAVTVKRIAKLLLSLRDDKLEGQLELAIKAEDEIIGGQRSN